MGASGVIIINEGHVGTMDKRENLSAHLAGPARARHPGGARPVRDVVRPHPADQMR